MRQNQAGFTLVEVLITAAILAAVLVTAGTFLLTSNRSQRTAVDLGSNIDAHAFVASLLNYDFRIACYGIEEESFTDLEYCTAHIEPGGKTAKVWYFEERFGESVEKNIAWQILDGNLVRHEQHKASGFSNISVVLEDVSEFKVSKPFRQLITFEIIRLNEEPINVSVAVLNPIAIEGGSQ